MNLILVTFASEGGGVMKRLNLYKIPSMCFPLARREFKRGVVLLIIVIIIMLVSMAMTGCVGPGPRIVMDDGSTPEPVDLHLCYDWGRKAENDLTVTYFYGADGRTVFESVNNVYDKPSDCDILVKFQGDGPVYSNYSKKMLMILEKPFSSDTTFPRAAKKLYQAFRKGSPLYQEVVRDREAFRKRQEVVAAQQTDGRTQAAAPLQQAVIIKSDVDDLPAMRVKPNKTSYAIVIGIENYRQKLPKADYAVADAKTVTEYLIKVMGYPEENIITPTNEHATNVDFAKYFEKWLPNNVEKDSSVFIYYSGHGAPNPKTADAYLVPYDGDPSFITETGYSLKRMYDALGKLQAKEIIVALDSCFSGAGGRSVIAKGARPLVMNLQNNMVLSKNMTVMSASSGEQISSTYDEKGHGLFTYFLLKGIKNEDVVKQDGSIKMDDLFVYLKPQVERIARKQYNNEQTPQLIGHNASLKD